MVDDCTAVDNSGIEEYTKKKYVNFMTIVFFVFVVLRQHRCGTLFILNNWVGSVLIMDNQNFETDSIGQSMEINFEKFKKTVFITYLMKCIL